MATESDNNSYNALTAKNPQACEFCDQIFSNRFSSIVHNSSHIIIPLSKHLHQYCEICYIYFNSTDDFDNHMSDEHRPIICNQNNDIEFDINVPEIKLEILPQLNRYKTFDVKEETFGGDEYDSSSSEDEFLLDIVKRESERKYIEEEIKNEEEYTNLIKNRLKFEVDHEYSGLLKDFTTDCEVNIQYTWNNNSSEDSETYNKNTKSIKNSIVYEEPVDELEYQNAIVPDVGLKSDEEYKSVHFSDLMSFGFYCCKYCYVYFSNRFSLIIHETTHMRIKKVRKMNLMCPQCDVYIAGNYRTVQKHETAVHGAICPNKKELRTCATCGLRYRHFLSHIKNYHPNVYESFEGSTKKIIKDLDEINQGRVEKPAQELVQNPLQETVRKPILEPFPKPILKTLLEPFQSNNWIEKFFTIKVCDLCYSFFKSSFKKTYILKGIFTYTTERPCDECKNVFFKLKTVRTIIRIHNSKMNRVSSRSPFTNEERLKKIQFRLKMINKLGKCYDGLLLMSCVLLLLLVHLYKKYNGSKLSIYLNTKHIPVFISRRASCSRLLQASVSSTILFLVKSEVKVFRQTILMTHWRLKSQSRILV